jgi:hypothetical protein
MQLSIAQTFRLASDRRDWEDGDGSVGWRDDEAASRAGEHLAFLVLVLLPFGAKCNMFACLSGRAASFRSPPHPKSLISTWGSFLKMKCLESLYLRATGNLERIHFHWNWFQVYANSSSEYVGFSDGLASLSLASCAWPWFQFVKGCFRLTCVLLMCRVFYLGLVKRKTGSWCSVENWTNYARVQSTADSRVLRDASVIQHTRHTFTERGTYVRILTRAQQGTWVECPPNRSIFGIHASYSVMFLKKSWCMFWTILRYSRE